MNKQENSKNLVLEVIHLILKFFKKPSFSDEILSIPTNVKKMGYKVGIMNLGMTIIALGFAFMLKTTNMLIEHRFILLGIILFMLYRGQAVIREAYFLFKDSESEKLDLIFNDEIIFKASQIIGKTYNKVLKYDSQNNLYKVIPNESVSNIIKNYLKNLWQHNIRHLFDTFEIISIILMILVAIITNTSVPQFIFIPMLIFFVIVSFLSSAFVSINRKDYYQKYRKHESEQSVLINDILRVPSIVNYDLEMRINKFQETMISSKENISKFHKKLNCSRLVTSIIEAFSQYGIIIFYLIGVKWNSISLSTIAEIAAVLIIVETALSHIMQIAKTLNNHNERIIILEKEEPDLKLILDVYQKELNRTTAPKHVENINLNPFSIKYLEESKNDKPFTLVSKNNITICNGEIALLYGPSGSGKSTFMKMLTERISFKKSTEIPSTSRYMYYDETLTFGSLSIFEELFCCTDNPDILKMQEILKNLNLWSEINNNCFNIWQWMKEKTFGHSLSNGQKQRLILAKMLYWLDDEIDVLVLDECTSGLDDKADINSADAEKILEYIVKYANSDKKRIIVISTHQNIEGFKAKLSNEFKFRNFRFVKDDEYNLIKEF
jgi:ABC-type transport system involved in cytochrome bd biosynthesis fused ATPase/permease subunit